MKPRGIDIDNWTTQLRKGLLELCIMNLLGKQELYGYDLVKQLGRVPGLVVTEGTIYPLLSRLRKTGLLTTRIEESSSGPARRYYALSEEGTRVRTLMNRCWGELTEGVGRIRQQGEETHG
ncbi:MAG: PadR family transcriptional regulator [Candidatus Hydrogenedentes bacterium]|nr:PadR family transcriptional regulator [Candidatus Hydrogenedentota bacterium]